MMKYLSFLQVHLPQPLVVEEEQGVVDSYIIDISANNGGALPSRTRKKRLRETYLRWLFALGVLAFLLALVAEYLLSPVTIKIAPVTVGREGDVTLVVKPSKIAQPQSMAWQLTSTATSAQLPVQGTGTLHQNGAQARGMLTWYNQTEQTQTVPSGTIISAGHTIQIITDADVSIPASPLPSVSQASGPAHVRQVGAQGNIAPGTVNTLCPCLPGVKVTNQSAFSGGSDEQTSTLLLQEDVDRAVAAQKEPLTRKVLDDLQRQVQSPEHMVATPVCSSSTSANHPIGSVVEPGVQIKASMTITCRAVVFDQHKVSDEATKRFTQQVGHDLGKQFQPGQMTTKIEQNVLLDQEKLQLSLHVQGTWVYRLNDELRHTLQEQLAGVMPGQAELLLLHTQGIRQEKILPACWVICAWLPLPRNPEQIQIIQEP